MSRTPVAPETGRAGLCDFLDRQRDALIGELDGLSEAQARQAPTTSTLSLLSLIRHSAIWERRWFQVIVAGPRFPGEWPEVQSDEPDPTFRLTAEDTIEAVVAEYREQIAASQEVMESLALDTRCALPEMVHQNLRWVALHMIKETARHAGHADIIRETIDSQ